MGGKKCSPLCMLCKVLAIVGALNWGLVGIMMLMDNGTNLNLVNLLLGSWPVVEAIVYLLVGLAGLVLLVGLFKGCGDKSDK